MPRKKFLIIILLLFGTSCSKDDHSAQEQKSIGNVRSVTVEVAKPMAVEDFFTVAGIVKARRSTVLSSKVTGTVTAVAVNAGDRVRKEQTLVQIDNRELRAELASANAALDEVTWVAKAADSALLAAKGQRELAATTYQRYEGLFARESVTRQEFDEINTKYKVADAEMARAEENRRAVEAKKVQAEARIAQAQTLLDQTTIKSPYEGVVTDKPAELGMLASPGTPLISVEEGGSYRLDAQVGESEIRFVQQGKSLSVNIDAIPVELTGTVVEIVPAADPQSRTFTVKVQLPADPALRSGLYGKARFPAGRREVIALPTNAILPRGELQGVFVVGNDGVVHFRLVKTGKTHGDRLEMLSGINPGERVATRGAERLNEGEKVQISQSSHAR
jgi:membrane fusion protein, multidrug efflux system